MPAAVALLQVVHRFCARHLCVTCLQRNVFRELIAGLQFNAVPNSPRMSATT